MARLQPTIKIFSIGASCQDIGARLLDFPSR
jgi:hypothetical protein